MHTIRYSFPWMNQGRVIRETLTAEVPDFAYAADALAKMLYARNVYEGTETAKRHAACDRDEARNERDKKALAETANDANLPEQDRDDAFEELREIVEGEQERRREAESVSAKETALRIESERAGWDAALPLVKSLERDGVAVEMSPEDLTAYLSRPGRYILELSVLAWLLFNGAWETYDDDKAYAERVRGIAGVGSAGTEADGATPEVAPVA